jgi:hypothetical protein
VGSAQIDVRDRKFQQLNVVFSFSSIIFEMMNSNMFFSQLPDPSNPPQSGGPLKGPAEFMLFGVAGTLLGAGLAARFYGQPMMGAAVFSAVGGTIAGGMVPIPFGGFIGAALAVHYFAGLPYTDGVVISLGSAVGMIAGVTVAAEVYTKKML